VPEAYKKATESYSSSNSNFGLCDGKISQFRQKTRPILTLLGQSWVENARKNVCFSTLWAKIRIAAILR
jgi:hypothetical protein